MGPSAGITRVSPQRSAAAVLRQLSRAASIGGGVRVEHHQPEVPACPRLAERPGVDVDSVPTVACGDDMLTGVAQAFLGGVCGCGISMELCLIMELWLGLM